MGETEMYALFSNAMFLKAEGRSLSEAVVVQSAISVLITRRFYLSP